ncbi:rRNA-binding ribosome biosynthesis protein RPF2 [Sporobolomyces salmoneus]|uniref:rRNA-binding ribosome biosynthesis protein RPF2 n=1 Tax=Sporobolomyces salmoneus TaxID=183962 RepID=UPI00316DCBED
MSTPIIAPAKPKNARSKRAAVAREPKLVEKEAKTAVFVRSAGISDKVKTALTELNQLKKPHSITFSKSNLIRPFEDAASLNFWSSKNDASLFLIGTHTKKRPHGLVWVRCFAGEVMEMLEVGIEEVMAMSDFKGIKSTAGSVPLFHFSATEPHSTLWDSHPTYQQFKSILLDFFRGNEMDGVALKGLERVISVTIGSSSAEQAGEALQNAAGKGKAVESLIGGLNRNPSGGGDYEEDKSLPVVHFRTYNVHFMRSGVPTPRVELSPHGPHFTFSLRRSQKPAQEVWKLAMKKKEKKSTGSKPKNKNIDINEMGDKVGRVHVDRQDLSQLQTRKFKGLKKRKGEDTDGGDTGAESEGGAQSDGGEKPLSGGGGEGRKRKKV